MLDQSLRKRKQPEPHAASDPIFNLCDHRDANLLASDQAEYLGSASNLTSREPAGDPSRSALVSCAWADPASQSASGDSGLVPQEPQDGPIGSASQWRSQKDVINFLNSSASLNHDAFSHTSHKAAAPRSSQYQTAFADSDGHFANQLAPTSLSRGRGFGCETLRQAKSRSSLAKKLERCVVEYEEQRLIKSASETAAALQKATLAYQRSVDAVPFPQSSSLPGRQAAPNTAVGSNNHVHCSTHKEVTGTVIKGNMDPSFVTDNLAHPNCHDAQQTNNPFALMTGLLSQDQSLTGSTLGPNSSHMQLPSFHSRVLHEQRYKTIGSECPEHTQPKQQQLSAAAISQELQARFGSHTVPHPLLPAALAPPLGPLALQRYHSHDGKALSLTAADALMEKRLERRHHSGVPTGSWKPSGRMMESTRSPARISERMMMRMKSVSEAHVSTAQRSTKVGRSHVDVLSQQTLLAMEADCFSARQPATVCHRETLSSRYPPLQIPSQSVTVFGEDGEDKAVPGAAGPQLDIEDDPEAALDAILQRAAAANSLPSAAALPGAALPPLSFPVHPRIAPVIPAGRKAGEDGTFSFNCFPASFSATNTSTRTTHLHSADYPPPAHHGFW